MSRHVWWYGKDTRLGGTGDSGCATRGVKINSAVRQHWAWSRRGEVHARKRVKASGSKERDVRKPGIRIELEEHSDEQEASMLGKGSDIIKSFHGRLPVSETILAWDRQGPWKWNGRGKERRPAIALQGEGKGFGRRIPRSGGNEVIWVIGLSGESSRRGLRERPRGRSIQRKEEAPVSDFTLGSCSCGSSSSFCSATLSWSFACLAICQESFCFWYRYVVLVPCDEDEGKASFATSVVCIRCYRLAFGADSNAFTRRDQETRQDKSGSFHSSASERG